MAIAPRIAPGTDYWKGHFVFSAAVVCGNAVCTAHDGVEIQPSRGLRAKITELGWRKVKPFGWLCPRCLAELNGESVPDHTPSEAGE